jgi:cell division ATPase FtsA
MAKPKVLTGLDMGGGRVACVLAEQDAETRTVKALASSCVYCRGLKGGVVVDIKETASAVAQAVERCEKTAAAETDEVTSESGESISNPRTTTGLTTSPAPTRR